MFIRAILLHIFNMSLDQSRNPDLCADFDFAAGNLAVSSKNISTEFSGLLHNEVSGSASRCIIVKHIQRGLAGVKTGVAAFYNIFLVFFSFFILEAPTFHVFVETLIGGNRFTHCFLPFYVYCVDTLGCTP